MTTMNRRWLPQELLDLLDKGENPRYIGVWFNNPMYSHMDLEDLILSLVYMYKSADAAYMRLMRDYLELKEGKGEKAQLYSESCEPRTPPELLARFSQENTPSNVKNPPLLSFVP